MNNFEELEEMILESCEMQSEESRRLADRAVRHMEKVINERVVTELEKANERIDQLEKRLEQLES